MRTTSGPRSHTSFPRRWAFALLAAPLVLLGADAPADAAPEVLREVHTDLFEVLEEGNGVCSHAGDPDCVKAPTIRRTRRIRLRTELLLGFEPGAAHLVRFNVAPGVSPTGWIAAGEKGQNGFVQWRAALDGDPLAWVGIFASPVPMLAVHEIPAAAPAAPKVIHDAVARAPDEPGGERPREVAPVEGGGPGGGLAPGEGPKEPKGGAAQVPKVHPPAPGIVQAGPPTGRSFLVSISSPRYGTYQVRGALSAAGTASVGVVTQMDYSGLLACGMGDDPSNRGHGGRRGACCRCCDRSKGAALGHHGAGDSPVADGSSHLGPVGYPGDVTPTTVSLLLLCTEESLEVVKDLIVDPDTPSGAMGVSLADSVARTNLALQRSGTGVTIDWVKPATTWVSPYAQVWYQTMPEIWTTLRDPQSPDFRTAHALRESLAADLVTLVVGKRNAKVCGWGDIYDVDATEEANAANAFSVVRFECLGDHSLTHEVAHAFGCCHDKGDTALSCTWPYYRYAHSFLDFRGVEWSTVMGVLGGRRVLGYSNPDLAFNATPDLDKRYVAFGRDEENNARMIREYAPKVAKYR